MAEGDGQEQHSTQRSAGRGLPVGGVQHCPIIAWCFRDCAGVRGVGRARLVLTDIGSACCLASFVVCMVVRMSTAQICAEVFVQ